FKQRLAGSKEIDSRLLQASPNGPFAVLEQEIHTVMSQVFVSVPDQRLAVPVESEQPLANRAKPKVPGAVFDHCQYPSLSGAGRILLVEQITSDSIRLPVQHG